MTNVVKSCSVETNAKNLKKTRWKKQKVLQNSLETRVKTSRLLMEWGSRVCDWVEWVNRVKWVKPGSSVRTKAIQNTHKRVCKTSKSARNSLPAIQTRLFERNKSTLKAFFRFPQTSSNSARRLRSASTSRLREVSLLLKGGKKFQRSRRETFFFFHPKCARAMEKKTAP